jgi:hypothetical protein
MVEILKHPGSLEPLPIVMKIFHCLNTFRIFKYDLSLRIEVQVCRSLMKRLHRSISTLSNEFLVEVNLLIKRRLAIMFRDDLFEMFLPLAILDGRVEIQVFHLV